MDKREKGYNYISYVSEIKEGGYIVGEYNQKEKHNKIRLERLNY